MTERTCTNLHDPLHLDVILNQKLHADEPAKAPTTAAASEAASTPDDSFCQLVGANMSTDTQCLDDWRLQMLELLPAAGIRLTQVQVCKLFAFFIMLLGLHPLPPFIHQAGSLDASIQLML